MSRLFQGLRNFRGAAMLSLQTCRTRAEVVASLQAITSMLLVALLSIPVTSTAAIVSIAATDFPAGFCQERNVTVKGFQFSPNVHFDIAQVVESRWPSDEGTTFVGIDGGCLGRNEDYLGPALSSVALYIDAGGRPFTLLELEFYGYMTSFISSKGGEFSRGPVFDPDLGDLNTNIWTETFGGGEWTGIKWLIWLFPDNAGAPTDGIVNLTFRVPEPSTLALLSFGLAGLAFIRRRTMTIAWQH